MFACTPVTHVLKITRRGEGGGGGGAHTWRWMTQNPRRNRELMAGSLALVNAFLPNNSRQPRGGERKRGGRRAKFNPSSPLQPSFFFFFFFLARLSRPSMPPLPLPFFLRWNRSLPSRVHARRKNTSWPWAAARRIKMRGTLVLRTAFNVATHDETRGFIIYISSEMKVDGRGGAETRKSGGERSARQFFRRCCFVKNDWFYDWRFFLSFFFFSKLNLKI